MTQTVIVIAILVAASLYLGRRAWHSFATARKTKDAPGCGPGCGCD